MLFLTSTINPNTNSDISNITSLIISIGAFILAGLSAYFFVYFEISKLRREFIAWVINRLQSEEQRSAREIVNNLTENKILSLVKEISKRNHSIKNIGRFYVESAEAQTKEEKAIRLVCTVYDGIGYSIVTSKIILKFKYVTDVYPKTRAHFYHVHPVIEAWRKCERDESLFIFFGMLAQEKRIKYRIDKIPKINNIF